MFVSAKEPVGTAQAVAAVFAKSAAVATPARADTGATAFAYDSFGKPGTIVSDQRIPAAGVRTIRFANNVRLNLKKTDFDQVGAPAGLPPGPRASRRRAPALSRPDPA